MIFDWKGLIFYKNTNPIIWAWQSRRAGHSACTIGRAGGQPDCQYDL